MNNLNVRIVKLEALHVASFLGFGKQPEDESHAKLLAWAKPKGYIDDLQHHRIFGFNNPDPSPGSPNYGYELWITVGSDEQPDEQISIRDFPGGLYAVARCEMKGDLNETIPAAWKKLFLWCEKSRYKRGYHQWLEEHLRPDDPSERDWVLDLYLPIAE
jgi:AraC family transcriptional regulator